MAKKKTKRTVEPSEAPELPQDVEGQNPSQTPTEPPHAPDEDVSPPEQTNVDNAPQEVASEADHQLADLKRRVETLEAKVLKLNQKVFKTTTWGKHKGINLSG